MNYEPISHWEKNVKVCAQNFAGHCHYSWQLQILPSGMPYTIRVVICIFAK